MISSYIGSNHHNIVLNNVDVANALEEAAIERGVPGFVDIDSSLMLFCKEVKKDFTVCLSASAPTKYLQVILGIIKKRFFLKMFFLGQEILTSGKEYLKMAF